MNSKQLRKARRDERFRGIVSLVKKVEKYTVKQMNDLCPLVLPTETTEACLEPHCPDRFGNWKRCERYQMGTPRTRSDSPYLHEPSKYKFLLTK